MMEDIDDIKIKVWGILRLDKTQFLIFELAFFTFFLLLTLFLFYFDFPEYIDNETLMIHSKYAKYISLICMFLIVIEAQFYLTKLAKVQLGLIKKQKYEIEKQNHEIVIQKEEIEAQRDMARRQRDKIAKQNKRITDSILYAEYIQSAMLPPKEVIKELLPESFVFYKPRDIVSGDFYWLDSKNGKTYIVAADCTGHGVPGAFMSLLGISQLNEIINKLDESAEKEIAANKILEQLRAFVIKSLHQTGKEMESKDGIDLALCVCDFKNNTLQYAGAYNPLYIIREHKTGTELPENTSKIISYTLYEEIKGKDYELMEIKGDRLPIGIHHINDQPFTNHNIKIRKDDSIYLFSDGYIDQFGGNESKRQKYQPRKFRELLVSLQELPMERQKEKLEQNLAEWQGRYSQVDDILIMGIRI